MVELLVRLDFLFKWSLASPLCYFANKYISASVFFDAEIKF